MQNNKGKFIVLYGINNLGKTTQAKMLVKRLNFNGEKAEYLKYPIYDLEPSGQILNNYLRHGNQFNLTPREAQIFYAKNRVQYEKELINKLENGIHIVAEDYTGTGLAWGIGAGVDEKFLKYINSHLLKEDLSFLFNGERFREAAEIGHKHETDEDLTNKVKWAHLKLGAEFGWKKINANLSREAIHEQLWQEVLKLINSQTSILHKEKTISNIPNSKFQIHNSKIKIQRVSPNAKLPARAHFTDAGIDLCANGNYTLLPGDITLIKTGIKMRIPAGCVGLIWDKSGIAANGLHVLAGVIDSGYRGEMAVLIKNLGHDIYNIANGQKIAQMLIQKIETPEIIEGKLDDTDRGENGFGSTGLF